MTPEEVVIAVRVLAAVLVGAAIGFERTFHGRPAGFRTHSLVCLASSLLMLVTVYQNQWMTVVPLNAIRTDPTRMAQGIMTGIGFLCAGVIFREGLTVHGLTTAASIWITAAVGVVLAEDELRRLIGEHGFSIAKLSYRVSEGGKRFEYGMVLKCRDRRNAAALAR